MIDTQLQAYHRFQRFIRITFIISGCWYMPTKTGKSTYYSSVCTFLLMIFCAAIKLNVSYSLRHQLQNTMLQIGVASAAFAVILKVGIFIINRGSLINHHQTLKNLFEEELMQNEKIRTIMFSSLRKIYILAYTFTASVIGVFLVYYLPQCLLIIRDLCHLHSPTTKYSLPFSSRIGYFWKVPNNFLYHFHFLFEAVIAIIIVAITTSVDCGFGYYVFHFASTMQAMTFRLTNPLPTEKFSDILRTCVVKHQKLLQCRNTLEHVYATIVLWHIVSNSIFLCALIYEQMLSEFSLTNLIKFAVYSLVKLFQTFMYAWYGTLLSNADEEFRKGIYFGEWPNSSLNHHIRTSIILMLMQKPMTIKAVFSTVDIVMFTNLVNTTMSYFFLLKSIGDNDE